MTKANPLKEDDKTNFDSLVLAAAEGRLALVSAIENWTGENHALLCVISRHGESYEIAPLARMLIGNPFDQYETPE